MKSKARLMRKRRKRPGTSICWGTNQSLQTYSTVNTKALLLATNVTEFLLLSIQWWPCYFLYQGQKWNTNHFMFLMIYRIPTRSNISKLFSKETQNSENLEMRLSKVSNSQKVHISVLKSIQTNSTASKVLVITWQTQLEEVTCTTFYMKLILNYRLHYLTKTLRMMDYTTSRMSTPCYKSTWKI